MQIFNYLLTSHWRYINCTKFILGFCLNFNKKKGKRKNILGIIPGFLINWAVLEIKTAFAIPHMNYGIQHWPSLSGCTAQSFCEYRM